ncbi:MAG: four helix bundle protein [Bacteroidales bacterium]|nr:four helix bundle protein [Bacteroidales bacterium]
MARFSFEELKVYNRGRDLVKEIYNLQRSFPKEETFALGCQIRRAAVSITANIAEGSGRTSAKDKQHFIVIAYGSLTEAFSELITACDLGYITERDVEGIRPLFNEVAKMLSGMRQASQKKIDAENISTRQQINL